MPCQTTSQGWISEKSVESTMSVSMSGWSDSVSVARINKSCNLNRFCAPMMRSMCRDVRPGGRSMRWMSVFDITPSGIILK